MELVKPIIVLSMYLVMLLRGFYCQTGTDAKNLRTKLFVTDAYDNKIRPTNDQSVPIAVYLSLYLLNINGLDEVSETLKTTGYLRIEWTDEFLQWDPTSYGGLHYYLWPQEDVWKPDVALKNAYTEYKELGVKGLNVMVRSDGTVHWDPFQVFQSTCSVDITYFPFDIQTCELKFVAWSYTKSEVDMQSGSKGIVLDEYESNSEWNVLDTSYTVIEESGEASMIFTLKIQRKPMYVILSIVMPIIMLGILNIFVFALPSESGEKAGYAITVFLAFAVFLTIISRTLPANSESVAIFSVYVFIQTMQSTVITLLALVMIRCNAFSEDEPVPKCLILLMRFVACKPSQTKRGKGKVYAADEDLKAGNANVKFVSTIEKTIDAKYVEDETDMKETVYTWKIVISALDKLFFCLFSIIFVTSTITCFTVSLRTAN